MMGKYLVILIVVLSHEAQNSKENENVGLSHATIRYCKNMTWMKKYQRQYCYSYPKMIDVIKEGVNTALSKCRDRFRSERWNCTPLNWEQVLSGGGLLKKASAETAYVQALTVASVMITIARVCRQKSTKYCGCGVLGRRQSSDPAILEGCSYDVDFGEYLAKSIMGPNNGKSHKKRAKQHNQMVGVKLVRRSVYRKCECVSLLVENCWRKICIWSVPFTLEKIERELWRLYENPTRTRWNRTSHELYPKVKSSTRVKKKWLKARKRIKGKLVYFKRSENFCKPNNSLGIVGTFGRTCNSTSQGQDNCDNLCCGRSFETKVGYTNVPCNCRFVWCCKVNCETCKEERSIETCL
ncbi:protein Wnt-2-like [Xenia sp. Carnegie-2017]|uniref:protein Wnt-2-like n=1 Tax=Xenia sp. Carnegie-2017 TaxID=2897299 RepID=UPI001F04D73F|nr:protein Wnt-2-like [Xenia sp. Carnegie-2017]